MIQKQLGQVLFFPPNVAGWAGGKNWIDSSTLMLRMRLPSLILNNGEIENNNNSDDPEDIVEQPKGKFDTTINWVEILNSNEGLKIESLSMALLAKQPDQKIINAISIDAANDVKEQIIKLVSLPEYNLC